MPLDDRAIDPTMVPPQPAFDERPASLVGQSAGQFRLVRELGRGGMGTVYLGEHALIGSRVAVKVLHPHLSRDPMGVERFFAEARAVNLIGHENIVRIFDMDQMCSGEWFLVMEYLVGQPLSELARKPLAEKTIRTLLSQLLDALDAAHARGIVHRDVKPENVFVTPRADGSLRARLLDFGIARFFSSTSGSRTMPGMVMGTPAFMAPEQWEGAHVDGRADLYALGVMGWMLATGRSPLSGPGQTPVPLPESASLSQGLRDVLEKAMAPRKEDRFATAIEMKEAVEALEHVRTVTPAATPITRAKYPVTLTHGGKVRQLACEDLSRAGAFIRCDDEHPPIRSLVMMSLSLPGGTLGCRGEVVRHVSSQEARNWKMAPGFAVQFLDAGRDFSERLTRLMSHGQPRAEREDRGTASRIRELSLRLSGDPYALLSVPHDASFPEIRNKARAMNEELLRLSGAVLSDESRAKLVRVQEQVHAAAWVLGNVQRRAEYDGRHGNHRGVARCFAAGLTVSDAERLRGAWLVDHERDASRAQLHRITADLHASHGDVATAISEYEKALAKDPLNLQLHQALLRINRT